MRCLTASAVDSDCSSALLEVGASPARHLVQMKPSADVGRGGVVFFIRCLAI